MRLWVELREPLSECMHIRSFSFPFECAIMNSASIYMDQFGSHCATASYKWSSPAVTAQLDMTFKVQRYQGGSKVCMDALIH